MENLERMHQLHQNSTTFVDGESKEITVPQNSDNISNTNNTAQIPGTHLRKWVVFLIPTDVTKVRDEKYTGRHYGDIYDLSKKREDRKTYITKMKMQKTMLHEMPPLITRRRFFTISRKHPIYHHHHIPLITQILLRKISKFRASIIIRWKA